MMLSYLHVGEEYSSTLALRSATGSGDSSGGYDITDLGR